MKFVMTEEDLCIVLFKVLQASPDKDSLEVSILDKNYGVRLLADKIEQKYIPKITDLSKKA